MSGVDLLDCAPVVVLGDDSYDALAAACAALENGRRRPGTYATL